MKMIRKMMLVTGCAFLSVTLMACELANASEGEVDGSTLARQFDLEEETEASLNLSDIQEEIAYIETLIGVEELEAAKTALNELVSMMSGPVGDETVLNRISELKTELADVEVLESDSHNHIFTGIDAVSLAVERYGADDDIVYMYDENHEHMADDQIGYYVALKSKALAEQEESEGVILVLFIGEDGSITELEWE